VRSFADFLNFSGFVEFLRPLEHGRINGIFDVLDGEGGLVHGVNLQLYLLKAKRGE